MSTVYKTFGNNVIGYINETSDEETLHGNVSTFFCGVADGYDPGVTLPDPATMAGQSITFIMTINNSENRVEILGNIAGNPSGDFGLSFGSVIFVSDGNTWWNVWFD